LGLDVSPAAIENAAQTCQNLPNIQFMCSRFPTPALEAGSFDLICALDVLYYFEGDQVEAFLAEIKRLLTRDGIFLLSVNVYGASRSKGEEIRRKVAQFFRILEWDIIYRELYYRIELPLIQMLEDIHYLRLWRPFRVSYPGPPIVSQFLNNRYLGGELRIIDRFLLPAMESIAHFILRSKFLFRAIERMNRVFLPTHGRNQLILIAAHP